MDETITVRDHSRQCEHGWMWPHWFEVKTAKWWQAPDCIGGQEMRLRRLENGLWEEVDAEEAGSD